MSTLAFVHACIKNSTFVKFTEQKKELQIGTVDKLCFLVYVMKCPRKYLRHPFEFCELGTHVLHTVAYL
jgi:hypothetical protein